MKTLAAQEIAKRVKSGDIIGVGTGTTVDLAIDAIAKRCRDEQLNILVVPSSRDSAIKCECAGLKVLAPTYSGPIIWGFDGADEVDSELNLIKGRGGAMLKEKILAKKCSSFIVIVDESKLVEKLGQGGIPIEVIPEAQGLVSKLLKEIGATEIMLREGSGKHGAVVTEAGNVILDVKFKSFSKSLERDIKTLVGVVESGLFVELCAEVIVASATGVRILKRKH
jgi:ribose 5-phosphate isomerase A